MNSIVVAGRPVQLGARLGKGGEGEVFVLANDPTRAVKLYTVTDLASRRAKVLAMIAARLADSTPQVSYPLEVATKQTGEFAGFVMRLVSGHQPLHELYPPGSRRANFPKADFRFLVRAALNVARAVASIHRTSCVIGDINHSSILISQTALVALIDADSFQVMDGVNRFLCKVGVPEYTPPELQGTALGTITRTRNHDAFGVAVVLFLLLFMGRHPFMGRPKRGEPPSLDEAIKGYQYAFSEQRDVGLLKPPGMLSLSMISVELAELFERAFSKSGSVQRPTAQQWVDELTKVEKGLGQCGRNALHYYPGGATTCPWCQMETALGTVLFVPYHPLPELITKAFDPGAAGFNLDSVWREISAVKCPRPDSLRPLLAQVSISSPSPAAVEATSARSSTQLLTVWKYGRFLLLSVAVVAAFVLPSLTALLSFIAGICSLLILSKPPAPLEIEPFQRRFAAAEARWNDELKKWTERVGADTFFKLSDELKNKKLEYEKLSTLDAMEVASYKANLRAHHLHTFLSSVLIRQASLKGIGPTKLAALILENIESAADIEASRLATVVGFGPVLTQVLLDWRHRTEQKFVFNSRLNEKDQRELLKIRQTTETKAANLRSSLLAGRENLRRIADRVQKVTSTPDPVLTVIHSEREQALCDLNHLGASVPSTSVQASAPSPGPAPALPPSPPVSTWSIASTPSASIGGNPNCPRCGKVMVKRVARRGGNRGGPFWGCSQFPMCRATRPY
jgi:DNA-binding helix-hairpin-helix protein with protein kinase domain